MHATFSRNVACVRMSHDYFCCRLIQYPEGQFTIGAHFAKNVFSSMLRSARLNIVCGAVAVAINAGCLATKRAGTRVSWKRRRSLLGPFLCRKTSHWVSSRRYSLLNSLNICSVLFSLPLVSHLLHLSTRHSSRPKQVHRIQQNGLGEVDESFT